MNSMYNLMSKLTELSESKSTDNDFTKKGEAPEKSVTTTHKGGTKSTDDNTGKVTHKGKYGTEYQGDDEVDDDGKKKKAAAPAVKRGRGRPTKPENQAEKDRPDWSGFGVKKNVKLKPWDKKKTVKHSLKDWIENLDKALNEAGPGQQGQALTVKPLPGASQITNPAGKAVGVATDPATAELVKNASNQGKLTLGTEEMAEEDEGLGGNTVNTYFAWRVACRKAGGKSFTGGRVHDQCMDEGGQCVGEWKNGSGTVGCGSSPTEMTEGPVGREVGGVLGGVAGGMIGSKLGSAGTGRAFGASVGAELGDRIGDKISDRFSGKPKGVTEGKVKELSMDMANGKDALPDAVFKKKYGMSKAEMRKSMTDSKKTEKKPAVKESLLRESRDTMQHIIDSHKNEVKKFINGGDLDEHLYDALYDYYCNQGEMPYGTMKARDGDPYEWVTQRFDTDVHDYNAPGGQMDEGEYTQHYMDANRPSPVRQAAEVPVRSAQTPWSRDPIAALTDRVYDKVTDPFGAKPIADDIQFEGWQQEFDALLNEGLNVTANTGLGDGPDSVTISATEADAQELLDIVKSAGLGMFAGSGEEHRQENSDGVGFAGDAIEQQRDGNELDVSSSEPEVVDDQDGMMDLIKRMTGQGGQPSRSHDGMMDESDQEPGEDDDYTDQRMRGGENGEDNHYRRREPEDFTPDEEEEEEEDLDDGMMDESDQEPGEDDDYTDQRMRGGENGEDNHYRRREPEDFTPDEEEEEEEDLDDGDNEQQNRRTDEGYANDADKSFIADIEFMTKGLSGGLNNAKKTQSVGVPVTIASTPLKETTNLLTDYRKLAGN